MGVDVDWELVRPRCRGTEYRNKKIPLRHHNDNDNRRFKNQKERKKEGRKERKKKRKVEGNDTGVIGKEVREKSVGGL